MLSNVHTVLANELHSDSLSNNDNLSFVSCEFKTYFLKQCCEKHALLIKQSMNIELILSFKCNVVIGEPRSYNTCVVRLTVDSNEDGNRFESISKRDEQRQSLTQRTNLMSSSSL